MKKQESEMNVIIENERFRNGEDTFFIYSGVLLESNLKLDVSLKSFMELDLGECKILGVQGEFRGQTTIQVNRILEKDYKSYNNQKLMLMSAGFTEGRTEKIIKAFDNDFFNLKKMSDEEIDALKIPGVAKTKDTILDIIREKIEDIEKNKEKNNLMLLLSNSKISNQKIKKIMDKVDIEELQDDPYNALINICEIPFKQADSIVLAAGLANRNDLKRLKYMTLSILKYVLRNGNTYTDIETFKNEISMYIKDNEKIDKCIYDNDLIVVENENVFMKKMYDAEQNSALYIKKMIDTQEFKASEDKIKEIIETELEPQNGFKYDEIQKEAIIKAVRENIILITGGAGCGKSTVLKGITKILSNEGLKIQAVAPTGKASKVMENIGLQATTSTIHSYLFDLERMEQSLSIFDLKDVLIVDESSMVDQLLFENLMYYASKYKMKTIIVGDPGQLPSVGNGNVLESLINSKCIPIVELKSTHRQKEGNKIIEIAQLARNNKPYKFNHKEKDVFCKQCHNEIAYLQNILNYYEYLKNKSEYKNDLIKFYNEIQITIPGKKGNIGVEKVNEVIKYKYNENKNEFNYHFAVNDKVMIIQNDKDYLIVNGDTAIVRSVSNASFTLELLDDNRIIELPNEYRNSIMLAYAATVHKLQGSQYKYVIFVLTNGFADSRLSYTAITRAKETLIFLSDLQVVNSTFMVDRQLKRHTKLKERIMELCKK